MGSGESEPLEKDITISVNVFYNLKNGKQVGRCYNVSLNSIMSAYDTLYASEEYKKGLYPVFEENTGELSKVVYKEAGSNLVSDTGQRSSRRGVKGIPGRPSDSDCGRQKTGRSGRKPGVYR